MRQRRDVYQRGGQWWGIVGGEQGRAKRVALGIPATAPRTDALAAWLARQRDQRASDAATKAPRLQLALDTYVAEQGRRGRSAATVAISRTKGGHFLRVWGAQMPLRLVTGDLLARYVESREAEGAKPLTIRRELDVLRGALKVAIRRGWYDTPLERVMPDYAGRYEPVERWLTADEVRKLCATMSPDRAAWVAFVVGTGARRSEAMRAHVGDVDWRARTVLVRGSKTAASWKRIAITTLQEPLLRFALKHARPLKDGRLFRPWASLSRDLHAACGRAELAPCTPNDLRRTLGHWLRHAGVEPALIGKMLRHADSTMAERVYAKGDEDIMGDLIRQRVQAVPEAVPDRVRKRGQRGQVRRENEAEKRRSRAAG